MSTSETASLLWEGEEEGRSVAGAAVSAAVGAGAGAAPSSESMTRRNDPGIEHEPTTEEEDDSVTGDSSSVAESVSPDNLATLFPGENCVKTVPGAEGTTAATTATEKNNNDMWMIDTCSINQQEQEKSAALGLPFDNQSPVGMISGQHHHPSLHILPRLPSTIFEESEHDEDHRQHLETKKKDTSTCSNLSHVDMGTPANPTHDKKTIVVMQRKRSFSLNDLPSLMTADKPQNTSATSTLTTKTQLPLENHTSKPQSDDTNALSEQQQPPHFVPYYMVTRIFATFSRIYLKRHYGPFTSATWIGFWALLMVTCANYVLTPMRDAIALAVGVHAMPQLTLASTLLAFCSSVPIGWLFEAPDPSRRRLFKCMGLTRGETQGTSLALFYRCFALILLSYAIGFPLLEWLISNQRDVALVVKHAVSTTSATFQEDETNVLQNEYFCQQHLTHAITASFDFIKSLIPNIPTFLAFLGQALNIAFFLVVHLMKLHSLSLMWGVTSEAMEYEEAARQNLKKKAFIDHQEAMQQQQPTRLQRLALIGFGGTVGGIFGSVLASSMAQILYLPGLLVLAAILLEISAELSIELGRIMQKHWEQEQQKYLLLNKAATASTLVDQSTSSNNNNVLDTSMRRSMSLGSMKRVASGNSLNRVHSAAELHKQQTTASAATNNDTLSLHKTKSPSTSMDNYEANDNTFFQRLLRGVTAILRSRLLMSIFTYNALYASTTVLLSFQRAALVANRNQHDENASSSKEVDMAFLANINVVSSIAIFALQASGAGASLAQYCGPQGTLALMPMIRLAGVLALAWWHHTSQGKPPNLLVFLVVDECCKVMNLAVAKPVRENLWRGLSNEARYEAKPIVDTLANRWGGGSAAFLVSTLNKTLDLFGVPAAPDGSRLVFGYPPILFLCILIAAWWAVVSADLGQIRRRIDAELKKRQ